MPETKGQNWRFPGRAANAVQGMSAPRPHGMQAGSHPPVYKPNAAHRLSSAVSSSMLSKQIPAPFRANGMGIQARLATPVRKVQPPAYRPNASRVLQASSKKQTGGSKQPSQPPPPKQAQPPKECDHDWEWTGETRGLLHRYGDDVPIRVERCSKCGRERLNSD